MMKKQARSIQNILTTSFLTNMVIFLVIAALATSLFQYFSIRENIEGEMNKTCEMILNDVELQIKQMDTVCLNTIHATHAKKWFHSLIHDTLSPFDRTLLQTDLASTLTALKGVDDSVRQITMYDTVSGAFGVGNYTGFIQQNAPDLFWFEDAQDLHGLIFFPNAYQDSLLSKSTGTHSNRLYSSIVRMYYDEYQSPTGFVQVLKYYNVLFQRADHPATDYPIDVSIYDNTGQLMFPVDESNNRTNYHEYVLKKETKVYNQEKKAAEYIYWQTSDYSNFTVVVSINSFEFFSPIIYPLIVTLCIYLIALWVCYLISKTLSRRISAPIRQIYRQVSDETFTDKFQELVLPDSNIIEIEKLKNSLNDGLKAQKDSLNSIMLLKEQELQSQILALQSQMNPHFLYNSLNTIGAMIEEGITEPAAQITRDITYILRYISSNRKQTVTIEEELELCSLYLKTLRLRYGSSLSYDFTIPDEMLDLQIPKLCVQLLAENAVKFATENQPPWHIHIKGYVDEKRWYIDVIDNGPGFCDSVTVHLKSQMDAILDNGLLPSLEIEGMGMLNVFIRFYLLYGSSFIFDFGNLPGGGARVRIGGEFHAND